MRVIQLAGLDGRHYFLIDLEDDLLNESQEYYKTLHCSLRIV